jgi:solute carrier family 25 phosphate transporter 23/24/25/41
VLQILQTVPVLKNSRDNMSTDICVHFVGGGLAGITAATATYPLDLVRTRLAAQVRSDFWEAIFVFFTRFYLI